MVNPEPILSDDLQTLSADEVCQHNKIYSQPDIKVTLKTGTYRWHWSYSQSVPAGIGVTLEGACSRYRLVVTKFWQANNESRAIKYSDYETSIACILFSAVHEELLCIIERILDDQCLVTTVDPAQCSYSPDELKQQKDYDQVLGFRLSDQFNDYTAQGVICMSFRQLARISRQPRQYYELPAQRFERLLFNIPLQIDSVSLSCRELSSLVPGSVIKLDNNSLIENKAIVSIVMGMEHHIATITETRGKINVDAILEK